MDSKSARRWKIKLIDFFFFFLIVNTAWSTTLPKLITKQAINNLRFLSSDGSFTYYQNREGSLLLSTNYNVKEIIRSSPGTNYQVITSPARKIAIIIQQELFHKFFGIRQLKKIYKVSFGDRNIQLLGEGINPKLHQNDNWVSIYHPITKVIKFINLRSSALTFEIKIRNTFNPYFIPEVVMPNKNTIILTDLNKDGFPGVLYYDKLTKKLSLLYKASNPATKIELCLNKDSLYLGEFGLDSLFSGSIISKLKTIAIDFSKRELIYESSLNDIGNIQCHGDLFFVKNLSKERNKLSYEVVKFIAKDQPPIILSDVNFANQIIDMDGVILLPHLGNYYVLRGKSDFTKADLLKRKNNIKVIK